MDIVSKELDEIKFLEDVVPRLPVDFNDNIKVILTRAKVSGISILLPSYIFKKDTANTVSDLNALAKYLYEAVRQKAKLTKGPLDETRVLNKVRYRFVETLSVRTGEPVAKLNIIGEYTQLKVEKPKVWTNLINMVKRWMNFAGK